MSDPTTVVYTGTRAPDDSPRGLELVHCPMLEVRMLEIERNRLLERLELPSAVVIYSKNAVRALQSLEIGDRLAAREPLQWWAIGPKTAHFLADRLGAEARVPDEARFEGLKAALREAALPDRVVSLSLRGKRRDLEPVLAPRGIDWLDIPVYETVPAGYEGLDVRLTELAPDWIAFTSRRGVRIFDDHLENSEASVALADVDLAAIGPKTASMVESRIGSVAAVPDSPGVGALLETIARRSSIDTERDDDVSARR
jgi:uroporphyrinogen-III synthase